MYFPILRGKQFEPVALAELAAILASSKKIVPVIEPVDTSPSLRKALKALVAANARFCLIVNPQVTDVDAADLRAVRKEYVDGYSGCTPTLYLTLSTRPQLVEQFVERFAGEKAFFLIEDPLPATVAEAAAASPKYVLLPNQGISSAARAQFDAKVAVDVTDPFKRRARNSDYPPDEFFTDAHLTKSSKLSEYFGDYSIVGDHFSKTGGPAFAVVLHHVYDATPGGSDGLRIAHYLSTSNLTSSDRAGKFAQALAKLVKAAPTLGSVNQTPVIAEYQDLHKRKHFPGLGVAKKLGIKHHLQVMDRIL